LRLVEMAKRPIFAPKIDSIVGVEEFNVEFKWHPGMAKVQKQKSIDELHNAAKHLGFNSILEVSSKSNEEIGIKLSAFNLMITTKIKRKVFSVETAFQSSKVFERGGPFADLLSKSSREAKKDERLNNYGNLISFRFFGRDYAIEPKTFFYDWIYINALAQNEELIYSASSFSAFTDIEFNPNRSINCQAYSIALFFSLYKKELLEKALVSPEAFLEILSREYSDRDKRLFIQNKLL